MEWSEGRTAIVGHVATFTAVLALPGGFAISGDVFGEICVWGSGGGCQMLDPPACSAATCVAVWSEDGHFLVGHADGELRLISKADLNILAAWGGDSKDRGAHSSKSHSGGVLAVVGIDRSGCIAVVACESGLFQAWHGIAELSRLNAFVEPAVSASFDVGLLVACGHNRVSLLSLDGRLCLVLNAPCVPCAALFWQHDSRRNRQW